MKHLGDITKIKGAEITPVDCITFGAPCQDLSVAGGRRGMKHEALGDEETTRSGLFFEAIRIIEEMREHDRLSNGRTDQFIRPRFAVYENVPGAFSSNGGRDFQAVLDSLVKIADPEAPDVPLPDKGKWSYSGCLYDDMGNWSVAWRLHDGQFWGKAQYIDGRRVISGTPQRRKRIAVVADFGGLCAPEILFERKGLSRHIKSRREAREETPGGTGESSESPSRCLNTWDIQSKHIQSADGIAESLYSGECRYGGGESYVLEGNGYRSSHHGDGFRQADVMYTLNAVEQHAALVSGPADEREL